MMLGVDEPLQWGETPGGIVIRVPDRVREKPPCEHAWTFVISVGE